MADSIYYEALCLALNASLSDIKQAYREHAKNLHPDRNGAKEATALFQQVNYAYHMLINALNVNTDDESSDELADMSFTSKENTYSVTIDVSAFLFLPMIDACEHHHSITPIDRGHHGLQFLPVHPEPLLVLELLVTLTVDIVTAALSGQARSTIVDYVHIPDERNPHKTGNITQK